MNTFQQQQQQQNVSGRAYISFVIEILRLWSNSGKWFKNVSEADLGDGLWGLQRLPIF